MLILQTGACWLQSEKRNLRRCSDCWVEDLGDAHAASSLLSVALSVISGRQHQVGSVDMFGTHQFIVVDSLTTQAPSPLKSNVLW